MSKNSMKQMQEKMRSENKRICSIDFADPVHRQAFVEAFGGEEGCRKELKFHYASLQQTIKAHEAGQGPRTKTLLQYEENGGDFVDAVVFLGAEYDETRKKLAAQFLFSFVETPQQVNWSLTAPGQDNVLQCGCHENVSCRTVRHETDFAVDQNNAENEVLLVVSWVDPRGAVRAQALREPICAAGSANVEVFRLDAPVPATPKTGADDHIVVTYGRQPAIQERVDYSRPENLVRDVQEMVLPCSGVFQLAAGSPAIDRVLDFTLAASVSHGSAKYNNPKYTFTPDNNKLTFKFEDDWQWTVPSGRLPIRDNVDFLLKLAIQLKDGSIISPTTGSSLPATIPISYSVQSTNMRIHYLELLWGCLAKGTLVTMDDGRVKPIEDIRIGDHVSIGDYRRALVMNTWVGREEKPLWRISCKDRSITATDTHPFKTKDGWKRVRDICGSDTLLMGDGQYHRITEMYPVRSGDDMVYNLEIDSPDSEMICDGFVVGDFNKQNRP